MFGNFTAQAGVLAFNEVSSPNIIKPDLTWNFNNVIVMDFNPPGIGNINDRPRINIWRDVLGNPDFNYLQYISGGRDILSPAPTGVVIQPWGDRRAGTYTFPKTSVTNNGIIAGIDVFTHVFAPIKTNTLSPPINQWVVNNTGVTGEIQYQYRFIVGQKNPQINVELDYKPECLPVTIPTCTASQFLVYVGNTGINGCPYFICQNPSFFDENGSLYNNVIWQDFARQGGFGSWTFTSGINSIRNISNSTQNGRTSIGLQSFYLRGGTGSSSNSHIGNFTLDNPIQSGDFLSLNANYSWNLGTRLVEFRTGNNWALQLSHTNNDELNLNVRNNTSINTTLIDINAFNKAYNYRIENLGTGLQLIIRNNSLNQIIYSNIFNNINNEINGLQFTAGGLNEIINPIDYNNYGLYINNIQVRDKLADSWNLAIQITSPNQTFSIHLENGINPNFIIDWGDGSVPQNYNTLGVKTKIYSTIGNYIVKIKGGFTSNGNIRIGDGSLNGNASRLISTSVIPNIPGLKEFFATFFSCTSLISIPDNLFINNPNVDSFTACFRSCTGLLSIPNNLFANNLNTNSVNLCFNDCDSLTSIPENLFTSNTLITDFSNCFSECPLLNSIPANLFTNNINAIDFGSTFRNCTALNSVPSTLFANNINVNSFLSCFTNVTLTTTSYSNLLINLASNAAQRQNNVTFGGGNSRYNTAGQTAKQTLQSKNWLFQDLGLQL